MAAGMPAGRRVVHLAGRLTDAVHHMLGAAVESLEQAGCRQVLVVLQDPQRPALVQDFDAAIERIVLPPASNPVVRWRDWARAAHQVLAQEPAAIVQVHGMMASTLAHALVRPIAGAAPEVVMALPHEARVLRAVSGLPVSELSVPVGRPYFDVRPYPDRRPLVVGGVFEEPAPSAARFAQVAVLMGGIGGGEGGDAGEGERSPAFHWLGPAWGKAREQLDAASIGIFDDRVWATRAARMAGAWVYLCPCATRGFPIHLAEAMACGLPAVALDAPVHRELLRDGETGFLCADEAALVERVTRLIENDALRVRMGRAARREAWRRFSGARFGHTVNEALASHAAGLVAAGAPD